MSTTGGKTTFAEIFSINTDHGSDSHMEVISELTQENTLDFSQDNSSDLLNKTLEYPLHATDVPKEDRPICKPVVHQKYSHNFAAQSAAYRSPPSIRFDEGSRSIPYILKGKSFQCLLLRNGDKILVYENSDEEISDADLRALKWWKNENYPTRLFEPGDILDIRNNDYNWF
jgi:hypothetical protein